MSIEFKNDLLIALREKVKNENISLPENIDFDGNGNAVEMKLSKEAAGYRTEYINMQKDDACFEGWAIAIKTYFLNGTNKYKKIVLKIVNEDEGLCILNPINGHLGRFLYRALRFSQQYAWFELSNELRTVCDEFEQKYLLNTDVKLINNMPAKNAGDRGDESHIEKLLSEDYCLNGILGVAQMEEYGPFRQLPVGLFVNKVAKANAVFTGNRSAIDLWLFDNSSKTLNIVELKFHKKMVGIITEVFFYSNYIYDMILRKDCRFFFNDTDKIKGDDRGYNSLINIARKGLCDVVKGVMLNDKMTGYHPLVNKDTIDVLNSNNMNGCLIYDKADYDVDKTTDKVLLVK